MSSIFNGKVARLSSVTKLRLPSKGPFPSFGFKTEEQSPITYSMIIIFKLTLSYCFFYREQTIDVDIIEVPTKREFSSVRSGLIINTFLFCCMFYCTKIADGRSKDTRSDASHVNLECVFCKKNFSRRSWLAERYRKELSSWPDLPTIRWWNRTLQHQPEES